VKVKLYFLSPDDTQKLAEDAIDSEAKLPNNDLDGNAQEMSSAEDDDDSLSETDDDDSEGCVEV